MKLHRASQIELISIMQNIINNQSGQTPKMKYMEAISQKYSEKGVWRMQLIKTSHYLHYLQNES